MNHERRFDLADIRGGGLGAIERHRGREIRDAHCQRVDDAATEAKTHRADLASALGARLEVASGSEQIFHAFCRV
jgi:hypothetical protein